MCDIRLTRGAQLITMRCHSEVKGAGNHFYGGHVSAPISCLREESLAELPYWPRKRADLSDRIR